MSWVPDVRRSLLTEGPPPWSTPVFHQLVQLFDVARLNVELVAKFLDVLRKRIHSVSLKGGGGGGEWGVALGLLRTEYTYYNHIMNMQEYGNMRRHNMIVT